MDLTLPFCYFVFGFCLSFPAIATQFLFINTLKVSPVGMAFAYSLVGIPWTLKPLYGFISDKYSVFDWGKRRPYIFYSGLTATYMYVTLGNVLNDFYLLLTSLVFISFLICFADVATDSITVELVKKFETKKTEGVIQSNNWVARALGTVSGSFLGGMAFSSLDADTVYKLCGIFPFLMSLIIWNLPRSQHSYENVMSKLCVNLKEQKELALILLLISIAPNYGTFYTYFLTDKLKYTPTDFTWLNMSASISFLAGVLSFRFYFRKFHIKRTLVIAVWISVLFRLPQLLVVTGIYQNFWIVLCDGIIESYSFQLIIMPLIVYTAKRCNDGCEGSLFALMMSLSNLSGIIGDQLGAVVANMLNVTEKNFDNLKWLMVIAILGDLIIPLLAIQRMFSSSSEEYRHLDHTPELEMIRPSANTLEKSASNKDSLANKPGYLDHTLDSSEQNIRDSAVYRDHTQATSAQVHEDHTLETSEQHYSDRMHPDPRTIDRLAKEAVEHYETMKHSLKNLRPSVVGSSLKTDGLTLEEAGLLKRIEENYSDEIEVDIGLNEAL